MQLREEYIVGDRSPEAAINRPLCWTSRLLSMTMTLVAIDSAPRLLRGHMRSMLADWGISECTDEAVLIANELVSNAVEASAGLQFPADALTIFVRLITDGDILAVECWDQAPGVPVLRRVPEFVERGRGLSIIHDLTDGAWGYQPASSHPGKCVWAEISLRDTTAPRRPPMKRPRRKLPSIGAKPRETGTSSQRKRQERNVMSTLVTESAITDARPQVPAFLELEITQFCQLKCAHCYSESGPDSGRGSMTVHDWERLIDQAAQIGVRTVQFIGGEPTLDPDLLRLARHALDAGLDVDVYTNLVHVTPELWKLFVLPGVSVGFSWYSADPDKHAQVTGSNASHARTAANIAEAVRRGVRVRAGIVEVVQGQDVEGAKQTLRDMGVTDIVSDRARGVGRAARGLTPAVSELCGRCGKGRAAIGIDGQLTPCVLGRFLVAGNVKETTLGDLFAGQAWREILDTVPGLDACVTCSPGDSNDCDPSRKPA